MAYDGEERAWIELDSTQLPCYLYHVKATFDLPDALYREVKTRSAQEQRTVREVVVTLFQQWLETERSPGASTPRVDWKKQRAPLAHLVAEGAADHSMEAVRTSIQKNWDEPR